jgi:hypothetical protein
MIHGSPPEEIKLHMSEIKEENDKWSRTPHRQETVV